MYIMGKGNLNLGFCGASYISPPRPPPPPNSCTNPDGTCNPGCSTIFINGKPACGKCPSNQYLANDSACKSCPANTTSQRGAIGTSGCKPNTPAFPGKDGSIGISVARTIRGGGSRKYGSYARTEYNEDELNAGRNTPKTNSGAEERYLNQTVYYNQRMIDTANICLGIGIVSAILFKSF